MAKALIKLSKSLRNIPALPKYITTIRSCHSSVQIKEINNKIKTKISSTKELFELIDKDKDPSNLIKVIEENKDQIDGRHIVTALTLMQKFYQENSVPSLDVQKSAHFLNMCSVLRKHLTKLDLSELIQSLKVLNLLNVPSSSFLIQSILQLVRCSINDLYLEQIYYLSFLLKRMEPTNLSKAILQALPEVFVAQIQLQIDKENIKELGNALRFASSNNIDENIITFILDALNSNQQDIDIGIAVDILLSLCRIRNLSCNYLNVLDNVQNVIMNNVNLLEENKIINILLKIFKKTMNGVEEFYNPYLIDRLIERIVVDRYEIQHGTIILNKLNMIGHVNISLLDYLSSEIHKNPSFLSTCQPWSISTLVAGLAFANYKPLCWNELQQIILKNYLRVPDDATLYYFALHLASLDCFDVTLLKHVFTKNQILKLLSPNVYQTYQQLYQAVKTLYPTYTGPWPSEDFIQSFKTRHVYSSPKKFPLLPALETILGGSAFVKTNVKTSLGHTIDHLIILQDECPIAVETNVPTDSDSIEYVEHLNLPAKSKRIALLLLPFEAYGRNFQRLKGPVLLNIRSLESMSYKVVHIPEHLWITMPDHERLLYLKQLIGIKNTAKNNR